MERTNTGIILLKEAEQLAREKFLDREEVLQSLENALKKIARGAYGIGNDIRVHVDRSTGNISVARHRKVVEEVLDPHTEIHKDDPRADGVALGEDLIEEVPLRAGRMSVQMARQSLTRDISEIERQQQFEEFQDRVGDVISGVVKRMEFRNLIIDLGRAEGIIFHNELIQREKYRVGDRVKAYIYSVERRPKGAQIFLSRTHPQFLAKLFAQEVPEVADGIIEIKAVARDPGSRAKVAVFSNDPSLDPIGSCVGVRGNRVNAVGQELQGEKIDVIPWSSDLTVLVVNALTPAEVVKVVVEGPEKLTVVVPDNQQSIAIGRRGQNVELARQLTRAHLEIVSETEEQERRAKDRTQSVALFMSKLDIDEIMSHFLVSEGFEKIEEIVETPAEELANLEGFTIELALELKTRAQEAHEEERRVYAEQFAASGGDIALLELGIPRNALEVLFQKGIKTLEEFADLSVDDIHDLTRGARLNISENEWGIFIMKARDHVMPS